MSIPSSAGTRRGVAASGHRSAARESSLPGAEAIILRFSDPGPGPPGVARGRHGPDTMTRQPAEPSQEPRRGRVCVVGLGYIGLPTSAVLASRGFEVHGVEVDPRAREIINSGRAHIVEPDLDMLVQAGIQSGRLRAHAEPAPAEVFMLCVPTPVDEANGPNLAYVEEASRSIAPHLAEGNLVVLESTCPPGPPSAWPKSWPS